MKTMTNLEKFGLAAALIIACTFFYMKYIYDPQAKALQTTLKKRNKVVAELNKLRDIPPMFQLEKSIEKDQKILAELQAESGNLAINTGLPDEISRLLSKITNLIQANSLRVASIVPREREQGQYIDWSPFEMDVNGRFDGFMGLLKDIEALQDAVQVSAITMEATGVKAHPLNIRFTLKI